MKKILFFVLLAGCNRHITLPEVNGLNNGLEEYFTDHCEAVARQVYKVERLYPGVISRFVSIPSVPPVVSEDGTLFYVRSWNLVAFDLFKNRVRWSAPFRLSANSQITVSRDKVFVYEPTLTHASISSYDIATGKLVRQVNTELDVKVIISALHLYAYTYYRIYCYDLETLKERFSLDFAPQEIQILSLNCSRNLLIAETNFRRTNDGYVVVIDGLKGEFLWKLYGRVAGCGDKTVFIVKDWLGECWQVDSLTGETKVTIKLDDYNSDLIFLGKDRLFFSSNQIYFGSERIHISKKESKVVNPTTQSKEIMSYDLESKSISRVIEYEYKNHIEMREYGRFLVIAYGEIAKGSIVFRKLKIFTLDSLVCELELKEGFTNFTMFGKFLCLCSSESKIRVFRLK